MIEIVETGPQTKQEPSTGGLRIERVFTTEGVHPYDEVTWEKRDVEQRNWNTGDVIFSQKDVEFPDFWSVNASTIVTTKYFRGAVGSEVRESSLKELIDRVVDTYVKSGLDNGYFASDADGEIFGHELKYMLVHQVFSFNSPVWFNVGTSSPQQVSACFLLAVDDTMDSILNWYKEEGRIFKGGSGAGLNLSKIRSSRELLSSGGSASGPVSFMRGADASAGTIKSGGATRRAAKMVILDVDHPDIEEFVDTKAREEGKIRALRDAGFDMDLGGVDITSVQYQNANNSVRVSDEFMNAVAKGDSFPLRARKDGSTVDLVDARGLFTRIATAAWECADPGMQYHDTINSWHTNPNTGPITASNPCSEYMSLDNTSCNLASLNLLKFLRADSTFDSDLFTKVVELVITAMDISICFADFPTEEIGRNTRRFRQLGIGFANLGAMLMASGKAYDSDAGRATAGAVTSIMSGVAYRRSAEIAAVLGPYNGYEENSEPHTNVVARHRDKVADIEPVTDDDERLIHTAREVWEDAYVIGALEAGWRNAQISVLAPTGTIALAMDCDTTGVEPDLSLVKSKKLVGGGSMTIVNQQLPRALTTLGYSDEDIDVIAAHVREHGNVDAAPVLTAEHKRVFDCAIGANPISAMGHLRMMAACQPFLSGAISKTVNLPETATVQDIENIYMEAWRLGLKSVAVYRDNCKVGQPLSNAKTGSTETPGTDSGAVASPVADPEPVRRRLPAQRSARTTSFTVGDSEGYLTSGEYPDGSLGEIFLKLGKQGSTMAGVMDALSMSVSVGLQYGVPLRVYVEKYTGQVFDPKGITSDEDVRIAQSVLDYVFRRLALDYLDAEDRQALGIYTKDERVTMLDGEEHAAANTVAQTSAETSSGHDRKVAFTPTAPTCDTCGTNAFMRRSGACWVCGQDGSSSGCS